MKKFMPYLFSLAVGAGVLIAVVMMERTPAGEGRGTVFAAAGNDTPEMVFGQGYFRGSSMVKYRNKYAGFVSKVHIYSGKPVKIGDVILEYDDWEWRSSVEAKRNEIAKLEKELEIKKIELELKRLDPLPSDFRHINRKIRAAEEEMKRAENEMHVYRRLLECQGVSELDMRKKKQNYTDAKTAYENHISDQRKVKKGMADLHVRKLEREVELLQIKVEGGKRELALLLEEGKYYKITANRNGIIETHSDTVGSYNSAGTEAACVHGNPKGYYVYSYFREQDTRFMVEGDKAKYRCNHTGELLDLEMFEVDPARRVYGNDTFMLVKFRVKSPAEHLRVESSGIVELPLVHKPR